MSATITSRELFASKALASILVLTAEGKRGELKVDAVNAAKEAFKVADAMVLEGSRGKPDPARLAALELRNTLQLILDDLKMGLLSGSGSASAIRVAENAIAEADAAGVRP